MKIGNVFVRSIGRSLLHLVRNKNILEIQLHLIKTCMVNNTEKWK